MIILIRGCIFIIVEFIGPAGAGKSYLVKNIAKLSKDKDINIVSSDYLKIPFLKKFNVLLLFDALRLSVNVSKGHKIKKIKNLYKNFIALRYYNTQKILNKKTIILFDQNVFQSFTAQLIHTKPKHKQLMLKNMLIILQKNRHKKNLPDIVFNVEISLEMLNEQRRQRNKKSDYILSEKKYSNSLDRHYKITNLIKNIGSVYIINLNNNNPKEVNANSEIILSILRENYE